VYTSKEIRSHEFEIVKRGYNMDEVKSYLRQISEQIDQLSSEKNEIEQKMVVLADKLEDYKTEEDSIRSALLNAQKLGDNIIQEAKQKADIAFHEAELRAQYIVDTATEKVEREKNSLYTMQKEVAKFKNNVLNIYKSHLEVLSLIPDNSAEAEEAEQADASVLYNNYVEPADTMPIVMPEPAPAPVVNPAAMQQRMDIPSAAPVMDNYMMDMPQEMPMMDTNSIPEMTPADEQKSRFGQLDFGDNFSFKL